MYLMHKDIVVAEVENIGIRIIMMYNNLKKEIVIMNNSKKHNYIRDDLIIDFPLPKSLQEMIAEAELLDEEKNVEFLCVADMIDTLCKNCYAAGKITRQQWDLITAKYSVNADVF